MNTNARLSLLAASAVALLAAPTTATAQALPAGMTSIGLAKSDAKGRADVSAAIEKMVGSGEWRSALERNIGQADVRLPEPPKVTEK